MKKLIAVLIALVLVGSCQIANADVTITYRGSFRVNSSHPMSKDEIKRLNDRLNGVAYYKGSAFRVEIGHYTVIINGTKNIAVIIDENTKRYGAFSINDLDLAHMLQYSFRDLDPGAQVGEKLIDRTTIGILGHRCERYRMRLSIYLPSKNASVSADIEESYATDFPDIQQTNFSVGGIPMNGVFLEQSVQTSSQNIGMSARCDVVSISTDPIPDSMFEIGDDLTLADPAHPVTFQPTAPIELKGYMSAKAVDPNAKYNQFTGAARAQNLIKSGKFDDAGDLVRSLAKRHLDGKLGSIYNALADHAVDVAKPDEAWGYYSLAVGTSDNPDDIVHARFALESYYADKHDVDNARKQLQAILDLPSAKQEDKDKTTSMMSGLKPF